MPQRKMRPEEFPAPFRDLLKRAASKSEYLVEVPGDTSEERRINQIGLVTKLATFLKAVRIACAEYAEEMDKWEKVERMLDEMAKVAAVKPLSKSETVKLRKPNPRPKCPWYAEYRQYLDNIMLRKSEAGVWFVPKSHSKVCDWIIASEALPINQVEDGGITKELMEAEERRRGQERLEQNEKDEEMDFDLTDGTYVVRNSVWVKKTEMDEWIERMIQKVVETKEDYKGRPPEGELDEKLREIRGYLQDLHNINAVVERDSRYEKWAVVPWHYEQRWVLKRVVVEAEEGIIYVKLLEEKEESV